MPFLSRVVWREGMHLGPHHFQLQQRYFEEALRFAVGQIYFKPYGLTACDLSADAIHNGFVELKSATGLFRDGTPFSIPESDSVPEAVDVRPSFSPTDRRHLVHLTLPEIKADASNVSSAAPSRDRSTRLRSVTRAISDDAMGGSVRSIEFGEKNLHVRVGPAVTGELSIPIARVRSTGGGEFAYDDDFIPPVLSIGASRALIRLAQRILDGLRTKGDSLIADRVLAGGRPATYSSNEAASFWLQHTMYASEAPLRQLLVSQDCHPETLFIELATLAGALCTFVSGAHPRDLPLYEHDDLGSCFGVLGQLIGERLDWVKPTNYARIPLTAASMKYESKSTGRTIVVEVYRAAIADQQAFGKAHWILGLRSTLPPTALVALVPEHVKACSVAGVPKLVMDGRAGFELTHLRVPPPSIGSRSDTQYFTITRAGICDNLLTQSRELGVYIPESIPAPEVELFIVRE
jgi:type VI secretion system protein ImpJ